MGAQTIQLLTKASEPPEWWSDLQKQNTLSCDWQISSDFCPQADVIVIPWKELSNFRREGWSNHKSYVLVEQGWSASSFKRALSLLSGAMFADTRNGSNTLGQVLQLALARQSEREHYSESVREASQQSINRMREIIGFIKELAQLPDIMQLLPLIRKHTKEFSSLGAPILFVPSGEELGALYYLRGQETIRLSVKVPVASSARIRVGESEDSRFLANALARPVGKVLRIPLLSLRHRQDPVRSPSLLFEHTLLSQTLDELVAPLTEKLQPVSWALDRLILEQELKNTSHNWEITFDGFSEPIAILDNDGTVLRSNSQWHDQFVVAAQSQKNTFQFHDRLYVIEKYPIRMSPEAPPLSWVVYLRDETRSRKLKSQVAQIEKMSAIGQLAGHIAHELNNPLTGVRSLTQVLLSDMSDEDQVAKDLHEVEKASIRCQSIINNLMDFSQGGIENKVEVVDLNEIVHKTLPLLKSAIGRLRNDIELSDESINVRVEPHLMQQVIFNLINNACQAVGAQGQVQIRTGRDGKKAFFEASDNGPGIPKELQTKIFEPFFTTKAEGEGTGLGLSLSREFVRQFGGEIECESQPGRGTQFRVYLPLEEK